MSTGEFLVIARHCARATGGVTRAVGLGYRPVAEVADGAQLWRRGAGAISLAGGVPAEADPRAPTSAGPAAGGMPAVDDAALVVGATVEADPAERLLRWWPDQERPDAGYPATLLTGNLAGVRVAGGQAWILTDHLGSVAVHLARTDAGAVVVGTNLHHVAVVAGRRTMDTAGATELLLSGRVTFPHTLHADVTRLLPGTVTPFRRNSVARARTWWVPRQADDGAEPAVDDVADEVSRSLEETMDGLLATSDRVTVYFSGGADARALAHLATARVDEVVGEMLLDRPNAEWRWARAAAAVVGVDLRLRLRSSSHHLGGTDGDLVDGVGGYDLAQAHLVGLSPTEDGLTLDGWAADSLLRAAHLPVRSRRRFGITVPGSEPVHRRRIRVTPEFPEWAEEAAAVTDERARRHLAVVGRFRHGVDVPVWAHMWPASNLGSYSFQQVNRRLRPHAAPYASGRVAMAVASLPESAKADGTLYRRGVYRGLGLTGLLPTSDLLIPAGPSGLDAGLVVARRAARRVRRRLGADRYAGGSWQTPARRGIAARAAVDEVSTDAKVAVAQALAGRCWHRDLVRLGVNPLYLTRFYQLARLVERGVLAV